MRGNLGNMVPVIAGAVKEDLKEALESLKKSRHFAETYADWMKGQEGQRRDRQR
jgi:hypothetical protein